MSSIRKRDLKPEEATKEKVVKFIEVEFDNKIPKSPIGITTSSLFLFLFIYRLINALTIITYFQADEFFQCLEPAHKLVFGYGYITWEWHEKLRSAIHPLIYATGFKLISVVIPETRVDSKVIVFTSKVIGAFLGAMSDLYTYKFAYNYSRGNSRISVYSLIVSLLNPFNWYIVTRSFSNNLEMLLTAIGLAYWPFNTEKSGLIKNALFGSLFGIVSCIVRPTNAVLWICIGTNLLYKLDFRNQVKIMAALLFEVVAIFILNIGVDYVYYQEFTFPLYNFVEFNVIKSLAIFYGVAPWHFHIFQSVPIMTLTFLPFLLHYMFKLNGYKNILGVTSIIVITVFSLISHKEFRFIYPLQPIFTVSIAISMVHSRIETKKLICFLIIVLNILISIFFTRVNERGVIDVINYLNEERDNISSFGFLTPCHSTPWQSHLHTPKFERSGWALTCDPPLHLSSSNMDNFMEEIKNYRDESDKFFDDPKLFIKDNFPSKSIKVDVEVPGKKYSWPSRIIIFEPMEKDIVLELGDKYYECKRFFNSYFHWDDRRNGDLIVYCSREDK